MNKIKLLEKEIILYYKDYVETWIRSTSSVESTDFIRYDGYTYILKNVDYTS